MQSRDLVEAHRLFFSAKLYDHQGPIARGGSYQPPPPDRPRYEKCSDRARVKGKKFKGKGKLKGVFTFEKMLPLIFALVFHCFIKNKHLTPFLSFIHF